MVLLAIEIGRRDERSGQLMQSLGDYRLQPVYGSILARTQIIASLLAQVRDDMEVCNLPRTLEKGGSNVEEGWEVSFMTDQ
jgi:hypothetical protein